MFHWLFKSFSLLERKKKSDDEILKIMKKEIDEKRKVIGLPLEKEGERYIFYLMICALFGRI